MAAALKKGNAQLFFQLFHLEGNRGWGVGQDLCCLLKAACLDDGFKSV